MSTHVDKALRALHVSNSFPRVKVDFSRMPEVFERGDPFYGFNPRVHEWAARNGYELYSDFVGRIQSDGIFVYCRNAELASEFKLTFL